MASLSVWTTLVFLAVQASASCDSKVCVAPYGECKRGFIFDSCECNFRYSGTNCRTTSMPFKPAQEAVLPPVLYRKELACPFARWNPTMPERAGIWEQNLLDKYHAAWVKGGDPSGAELNDHNFDTKLGQGNSLGFYGASLFIDPVSLPQDHRIGLFSKVGVHPALVRFSDFGADDSTQLGRIAVKLPYPSAWSNEMNMLFTETLDTFPLNDYEDVAQFADDGSFSDALSGAADAASSMFGSALDLIHEYSEGDMVGKNYYSQLPYSFGQEKAFRYRLVPKIPRDKEDEVKRSANACRESLRKKLSKSDIEYFLEIQVHDDAAHPDVIRGAAHRWDLPYTAVGVLTIKQQESDADGTGTHLRQALDHLLQTTAQESAAIHKMFKFHPVMNPDEHRPVGEVNSFRADFYSHHADERLKTIHRGLSQDQARFVVPFDDLMDYLHLNLTLPSPTPQEGIFTLVENTQTELTSLLDTRNDELDDPQNSAAESTNLGLSFGRYASLLLVYVFVGV